MKQLVKRLAMPGFLVVLSAFALSGTTESRQKVTMAASPAIEKREFEMPEGCVAVCVPIRQDLSAQELASLTGRRTDVFVVCLDRDGHKSKKRVVSGALVLGPPGCIPPMDPTAPRYTPMMFALNRKDGIAICIANDLGALEIARHWSPQRVLKSLRFD